MLIATSVSVVLPPNIRCRIGCISRIAAKWIPQRHGYEQIVTPPFLFCEANLPNLADRFGISLSVVAESVISSETFSLIGGWSLTCIFVFRSILFSEE